MVNKDLTEPDAFPRCYFGGNGGRSIAVGSSGSSSVPGLAPVGAAGTDASPGPLGTRFAGNAAGGALAVGLVMIPPAGIVDSSTLERAATPSPSPPGMLWAGFCERVGGSPAGR